MNTAVPHRLIALVVLAAIAFPARAADLVALSPQTWERYIPAGKEVDGIYGDFALTNDQLISVIAHPRRGRNANMTVRDVGGCLIDLTRRDRQSDQLSAYYPGAHLRDLKFAGIEVQSPKVYEAGDLEHVFVQARRVTLRLVATPREKEPDVEVSNGAPTADEDPEIQIDRLALWDGSSDKLVQVNHPDIGWMFRDRDGNGVPDAGFTGMHGKIDVIEVHPPHQIFGKTTIEYAGKPYNNTIVNWLQLLNQGRRIPGVVNTDAHYNFHGSGWLRNYVKSSTDDPGQVRTLDVVHAAERGNVVMSSGPFMEVKLRSAEGSGDEAIPGNSLVASGGALVLKVRVQCPNWFDVDRVQVFLNGRPSESLNFTRQSAPEKFSAAVMKFDQEIPMRLDHDAHVIVAAIGERSKLGPVMGPDHAQDKPVAVSNPIFVDVDGGGFKHNGDALGELPLKRSN